MNRENGGGGETENRVVGRGEREKKQRGTEKTEAIKTTPWRAEKSNIKAVQVGHSFPFGATVFAG